MCAPSKVQNGKTAKEKTNLLHTQRSYYFFFLYFLYAQVNEQIVQQKLFKNDKTLYWHTFLLFFFFQRKALEIDSLFIFVDQSTENDEENF